MWSLSDFFAALGLYYQIAYDVEEYKYKCMYCGVGTNNKYYCSKECKDADTHEKS